MRHIAVLAFAALLAAPSTAFAGKDPCKGVKVKKDAFGSYRTFEMGDFKVKSSETGYQLSLGLNTGGGYGGFGSNSNEMVMQGAIVEFLMADESHIEITTSANTGPKLVTIMGVSITHYELPLSLTAEQMTQFTSQPVTAFRVMQGGDAWHTGEVKKKDSEKFNETMKCMLST